MFKREPVFGGSFSDTICGNRENQIKFIMKFEYQGTTELTF